MTRLKSGTTAQYFVHRKNYYLKYLLDFTVLPLYLLSRFLNIFVKKIYITNRILLIEPTHIGDILLTTPSIRLIKQIDNKYSIFIITSVESKPILEHNPYLSGIETINLAWYSNSNFSLINYLKSLNDLRRIIKKISPEIVINMRSATYHFEHIGMWLANTPIRVGYTHKGLKLLLTNPVHYERIKKAAESKLDLIKSYFDKDSNNYSLRPDLFIPENTFSGEIYSIIKKLKHLKRQIIGINPSANHPFIWNTHKYIELCKELNTNYNVSIVFLGTKSFDSFVEEIRNALGYETYSVCGQTNLSELIAVLKNIDILVTVDTGIRHIANALSVKTIVLRNGANSSIEFGKYVETEEVLINKVPCSPCGNRLCMLGTNECVMAISIESVSQKINSLLGIKC